MPRLMALFALACSNPHDADDAALARAREEMVASQIAARGVRDEATLSALRSVPRHLFVPEGSRAQAYADHPLSIGHGQTISQPYIVAFMTEAAGLGAGETVLEVGTGSGYQAAVLSLIAARVYTIEIVAPLAEASAALLKSLATRTCPCAPATATRAGRRRRPSTRSWSRRPRRGFRSRSSSSSRTGGGWSCPWATSGRSSSS